MKPQAELITQLSAKTSLATMQLATRRISPLSIPGTGGFRCDLRSECAEATCAKPGKDVKYCTRGILLLGSGSIVSENPLLIPSYKAKPRVVLKLIDEVAVPLEIILRIFLAGCLAVAAKATAEVIETKAGNPVVYPETRVGCPGKGRSTLFPWSCTREKKVQSLQSDIYLI